MPFYSRDCLTWFSFQMFSECPRLLHGVFTRRGGESSAPFDSLNCSFSCGDSLNSAQKNREKIARLLNVQRHACLRQEHGKQIIEITAPPTLSPIADGLITQTPGLLLWILHADCQAALFYDPFRHALCAVHCGWRGSVLNIYQEAVHKMHALYGSKPQELLVGISPSLGPNYAEFLNYQTEFPKAFAHFQERPNYFNFWRLSQWQLMECGILPAHIEIAGICTYSNPKEWFSYRRNRLCGRNATVACLL